MAGVRGVDHTRMDCGRLTFALWDLGSAYRQAPAAGRRRRPVSKPIRRRTAVYVFGREGGFVVRGARQFVGVKRISQRRAVGYLGGGGGLTGWPAWRGGRADQTGCADGCAVTNRDMTFELGTADSAGIELQMTERGTDIRLEPGATGVGGRQRKEHGRDVERTGDGEWNSAHRDAVRHRTQRRRKERHHRG